ncbi:MAG: hypothetical protein JW996_00095 [Candidatus Cloacimonetes bacterium]|nr:hypothetical protein [Candidatus Cloacimonadota bacterium]
MNKVDGLLEINKKKGFPRNYRFNQFIRWFTLLLATAAAAYAIWVIFTKLDSNSPTFYKVVPFVILFLAVNSMMKNLLSVNSIKFREDKIEFHFILRPILIIPWKAFRKMKLAEAKIRGIKIIYEIQGKEKIFLLPLGYPNILEIVNSIAELCPQLEYDEFLQNVIISSRIKEQD